MNLDNSYVVIDISELSGDLLTVGMSTATSILLLPKAAPWTAARPMTATTYLLRKAISVMKSTTINPLLMQMNPLMLSASKIRRRTKY